jgi:hypothetical protein
LRASGTLQGRFEWRRLSQRPTEELNPVLQNRSLPCVRYTRRPSGFECPDLESNQDRDLRRISCVHYTIGTTGKEPTAGLAPAPSGLQDRRLSDRATSAKKGCCEGSRTPTFWFTARRAETATLRAPSKCFANPLHKSVWPELNRRSRAPKARGFPSFPTHRNGCLIRLRITHQSERPDSNRRPPGPRPGAIAKLRYVLLAAFVPSPLGGEG